MLQHTEPLSTSSEPAVPTQAELGSSNIEDISSNARSSVGDLNRALDLLLEAEKAAHVAIQSRSYVDGKAAQDSIDISLDAFAALAQKISSITEQLHIRRVQVSPAVHYVQNAALPVMRLLPDVLPIVVAELAHMWRPNRNALGWIQTTHVCVAWRRALISIAPLWAGEVGSTFFLEGFQEILLRARDAPLTVTCDRTRRNENLPEYYWAALAQPHKFRTVDLCLNDNDISRLLKFLRGQHSIDIDSFRLNPHRTRDNANSTPIFLPSMRWLTLQSSYVPFHAPNLLGLSIHGYPDPSIGGPLHILDVLEKCANLAFLRLIGWTSEDIPNPPHRKVRLPRLQTLVVIRPRDDTQYTDLCQHFIVPVLRYLVYEENDPALALPTMTSIFSWLLSDGHVPPCISSISDLALQTVELELYSEHFRACLDDGSADSTRARLYFDDMPYNNIQELQEFSQDRRQGVHVVFQREWDADEETGEETENILDGEFVRGMIARCLDVCARSPVPPIIRNAHFDLDPIEPNWAAVLRNLVNVETLHMFFDAFGTLFPAAWKKRKDGSMPLPLLRVIYCRDVDQSLCNSWQKFGLQRDTLASAHILDMLSERRKAGLPLTVQVVSENGERKSWITRDRAKVGEFFELSTKLGEDEDMDSDGA